MSPSWSISHPSLTPGAVCGGGHLVAKVIELPPRRLRCPSPRWPVLALRPSSPALRHQPRACRGPPWPRMFPHSTAGWGRTGSPHLPGAV